MKRQIRLLAQADLMLLIADLFRSPENIRHSLDTLKKSNLKMLIDATGLKGKIKLTGQLHAAVKQARGADKDEWAGCYRLLFDSSMACPVNEAGYIRRDKGSIIGDVCGFYKAFGWTAGTDTGERPDHLLVELEFAAMLLVMSARAETPEQAELTETALANFTRHHMSDWLPAFCDQLKLSTTYPVFVEAANSLLFAWPALVKWHDWIVDPASPSTVGLAAEPESPYECGAPDLVTLGTENTN
jgi:TorA maturation chaperone TorD